MTVGRVAKSRVSHTWVALCRSGGPFRELTAGSERMLLLYSLEDDHATYRDIHWRTIVAEPDQDEPGSKSLVYASVQTSKQVSQTAVGIPAANCHDHHGIVPIRSPLCLPSTCPRRRWLRKVADPTSESAGRPEEAPTDSSPWVLPRDGLFPLTLTPLPFGPNRDHGGRDPPPRKSGAGHANVGQPADGQGRAERAGWVPRKPVPHERGRRRVLAASRVLQRPQIRRVRSPAEKSCLPGR